ncbi:hypothetical protein Tco_0352999 [Tanacetum coccineum]
MEGKELEMMMDGSRDYTMMGHLWYRDMWDVVAVNSGYVQRDVEGRTDLARDDMVGNKSAVMSSGTKGKASIGLWWAVYVFQSSHCGSSRGVVGYESHTVLLDEESNVRRIGDMSVVGGVLICGGRQYDWEWIRSQCSTDICEVIDLQRFGECGASMTVCGIASCDRRLKWWEEVSTHCFDDVWVKRAFYLCCDRMDVIGLGVSFEEGTLSEWECLVGARGLGVVLSEVRGYGVGESTSIYCGRNSIMLRKGIVEYRVISVSLSSRLSFWSRDADMMDREYDPGSSDHWLGMTCAYVMTEQGSIIFISDVWIGKFYWMVVVVLAHWGGHGFVILDFFYEIEVEGVDCQDEGACVRHLLMVVTRYLWEDDRNSRGRGRGVWLVSGY